ncbi:hypothetical protein [Nodularia sp. NIES-3585]|uniref:hypothetical protein n=1 Tax=Nodularia sp. NIES-3585 TaxID=1973477 RepID=UPI000B5CBCC8|nr:hypothetical protein [Nodularia sp. NIES-3585]GAX36226.1 hypothetical protein NIES3585_22520 [Nodularia sp. NIES-3585]
MIANFSYVDDISPSQAETISGGYPVRWGRNRYDVKPSDKVDGDWTVIWVRTEPSRGRTPDIFTYSANEAGSGRPG